jgi:hypothetical protein
MRIVLILRQEVVRTLSPVYNGTRTGKHEVNNQYFGVCSRNYTEATERGPMVVEQDIARGLFISV